MHLVVDGEHRTGVIDHVDRVVEARTFAIRARIGDAVRAGDQHGAGRQQFGELRQRARLACEKKRERQFRPDQMRHIAEATRRIAGHAPRQLEIELHHLIFGGVVELLVLLQVRLHDPQVNAFDEHRRRAHEPERAVDGECRQHADRERRRQPRAPSVAAIVGQRRRRGEDRDRQERHSPGADQRGALRQRERRRERVAERIPRESR